MTIESPEVSFSQNGQKEANKGTEMEKGEKVGGKGKKTIFTNFDRFS